MPSPSRRRKPILLLLTLSLLATSGVWAAGPAARNDRSAKVVAKPAPSNLLSRAWSFLTTLWAEEGCHIDPNGLCVTDPASASAVPALGDTGCAVDPNGRCRF